MLHGQPLRRKLRLDPGLDQLEALPCLALGRVQRRQQPAAWGGQGRGDAGHRNIGSFLTWPHAALGSAALYECQAEGLLWDTYPTNTHAHKHPR